MISNSSDRQASASNVEISQEHPSFLVIDHLALCRDGLCSLLEEEIGHQPDRIHHAADLDSGLKLLGRHRPTIAFVAVEEPGSTLSEFLQLATALDSQVIVISATIDAQAIKDLLDGGAIGFLMRESGFEHVRSAIQSAASGEIYLCPATSRALAQFLRGGGKTEHHDLLDRLTPREREVAEHLAGGKNVRTIAGDLGISPKTIEVHRKKIFDKLAIGGVAELTKIALREGLITLD